MRVELLFWEGCPSHRQALAQLNDALSEQGIDPNSLVVREVCTQAQAVAERFVGSPTIRVDGVDVFDPGEDPPALTCRVYRLRDGRISAIPDPEDLRASLLAARDRRHDVRAG